MSEIQAPAGQSLTQINHDFAAARASKLDSAIQTALASKLPTPPKKSASASVTPPAAASSPSAADSAETVPSADNEGSELAASVPSSGTSDPATDAPEDSGAEALAVDTAALEALATKKDLRGIEKALGLKDGVLGATNADYAALRRRVDAVESREKAVEAKHEDNTGKLIAKFGPVADLIGHSQKGDLRAYAEVIQRTTGIPIQVFVDHWARNMPQVDPRVLALEQENARLRAPAPAPAAAPQAPQGAPADVARAKADQHIAAEAAGHPALALKGGQDEVRAKWLASFDKPSRSFKLTPKQAADAVVQERRSAHENDQWVLAGKKPPAKKPVTRSIPRTGASESQPRKQNLDRNALIERGAEMIRRQKAADAARSRR